MKKILGYKVDLTKTGRVSKMGWFNLKNKLQKLYPNELYETFRYFLIDNNGIVVNHFSTSNKVPNVCSIGTTSNLMEIITECCASNNKVIVAHNHPSGNCSPSRLDIDTTNDLFKTFNRSTGMNILLGHVIYSGTQDSDSYAVQTSKNYYSLYENTKLNKDILLNSSKNFQDYVSTITLFDDMVDTVIFTKTNGKISDKINIKLEDLTKDFLFKKCKETGSIRVFYVSNNKNNEFKLKDLIKSGIITDATLNGKSLSNKFNLKVIDTTYSDMFLNSTDKNYQKSTWKRHIDYSLFS